MIAWLWAAISVIGMFSFVAIGDLISEELRGWLDLVPHAILRIAATKLKPSQRKVVYEQEWLPELIYVLRGAESRPITRLIIGVRFALGLFVSARRIARESVRAQLQQQRAEENIRAQLHQESVEETLQRLVPEHGQHRRRSPVISAGSRSVLVSMAHITAIYCQVAVTRIFSRKKITIFE